MKITYSFDGNYYRPDIKLNDSSPEMAKPLGKYGKLRQKYLKEHRTILYNTLLLTEKLYPHLRDTDEIARERHRRGVPEEIILDELIFE